MPKTKAAIMFSLFNSIMLPFKLIVYGVLGGGAHAPRVVEVEYNAAGEPFLNRHPMEVKNVLDHDVILGNAIPMLVQV